MNGTMRLNELMALSILARFGSISVVRENRIQKYLVAMLLNLKFSHNVGAKIDFKRHFFDSIQAFSLNSIVIMIVINMITPESIVRCHFWFRKLKIFQVFGRSYMCRAKNMKA